VKKDNEMSLVYYFEEEELEKLIKEEEEMANLNEP
jgi:hypothetical protein